MADALGKVTIFFEAQGKSVPTGWTETFWVGTSDLTVNVQNVIAKYVNKRRALLGTGAFIQAVRSTSVPSTRLSYIQFLVGKEGDASLFTNADADAYDPTQVDLLVRLQSTDGHRRQMWVGGLPDSVTDQLVTNGITGAFVASPAWKQFAQGIKDAQFQIRWKATNGPPPTYNASLITDIFPVQVRNRKRGRPFFLFRGRRGI